MQKLDQSNGHDIRVQVFFKAEVMVSYISNDIAYSKLQNEIREICKFPRDRPFTIKFIDDEGDPCTISSQEELDEAIYLYETNKDTKITIHIFAGIPQAPGLSAPGEDKTIYRRGARRWKKLYKVNGHIFQPKRFNKRAFCSYCQDRIFGLGRQGFKCNNCKLMVHKKCHKFIKLGCLGHPDSLPNDLGNRTSNKVNGEHEFGGYRSANDTAVRKKDNFNNNFTNDEQIVSTENSSQYSINDFNLLRVIGRGSYAKVLMVELKKTKRIYAMKVIKKSLVRDDEDIDWVQAEKHVFEIATNYPFLVGLHSCFQSPSRLFFIIEFVRGGDLMYHMQRQRKLAEEHARFYAAEISLALNYLHSNNIIYRDLKLDNVLLDHEGHIKLTDYGMCKENIGRRDTTSTFCGTPNYISPEQLNGLDYNFSVDWWALGVLLFEMLAGRSPFDLSGAPEGAENAEEYLFQVIREKVIRIPRSLSVKAQSILKGFLQKDPKERLGCDIDNGFQQIQEHPFFKTIDWLALQAKQIIPPYRPKIENDRDLEHFDPSFTNEPVILTPDDPRVIEEIDQSEFEGFCYCNPLLMSLEDCV